VVKPHNHRVTAAEQAIQAFKDAFIVALTMTDSEFPQQLWDKLAPQVQNTLNLLQASRINPNILAYETLNGPYNWDRYPLTPPSCKAIIYEAPAVQGSWAVQGTDAWYLGPSKDHYQCNLYYVPETRTYCILGSAELFPQNCEVPNLSNMAHMKALTKELKIATSFTVKTHNGHTFIWELKIAIDGILNANKREEQRVSMPNAAAPPAMTSIKLPIQQITEAPPIMKVWDTTAKRNLINTKHTH
jgi:hypothetical protein